MGFITSYVRIWLWCWLFEPNEPKAVKGISCYLNETKNPIKNPLADASGLSLKLRPLISQLSFTNPTL